MSTEFEELRIGLPCLTKQGLSILAQDMEKVGMTAGALIAARKEVNTDPSEAQKESGNYKKGHVSWNGLAITIENPKGSTRSGTDGNGKTWSITMKNDYGYFKRTEGKDGDQLDLFIGPELSSELVFVVNQVDPSKRKFDEHKCVIGCISEEQARLTYLSNYEKNWRGLGSVKAMALPEFKKWVLEGNLQKQAKDWDNALKVLRNVRGECEDCGVVLGVDHEDDIKCSNCKDKTDDKESIIPTRNKMAAEERNGDRDHLTQEGGDRDNKRSNDSRGADEASGQEAQDKSHAQKIIREFEQEEAIASYDRTRYAKKIREALGLDKPEDNADGDAVRETPTTVAVDLDGTLAKNDESFDPESIPEPRPGAKKWLQKFKDEGAQIIIFTCRGDDALTKSWLDKHEIPYDYVNTNPDQPYGTSDKVLADVYWDDRAISAFGPLAKSGPDVLERIKSAVDLNTPCLKEPEDILVFLEQMKA